MCVFFSGFQGFAAGFDEPKLKIRVNEPGFKCLPNSQFMDDCNTCSCDESGTLARCTAMACDPSERTKRDVNEKCVPGTTWMDDCNNCRCEPNGVGSCTRMMCTDTKTSNNKYGDQTSRVSRNITSAPRCISLTTFMKDCNRCWCRVDGIAVCTLKKCLKNTHLVPNNATLNHNHTHLNGNSTHRFSRQTKQTPVPTEYIYTQAEHDSPNFTCTPSQSFKIQCNTCWCAADGKRARFCTKLPCTKPK